MRLDVFTQVPHAFAWMTEQRPLAAVLGTELELRLFNYRDTTPLRAGQVDDEPYGGSAGMVLRVDVVAAALDTAYGSSRDQRVIALTPILAPSLMSAMMSFSTPPTPSGARSSAATAAAIRADGRRRSGRRSSSSWTARRRCSTPAPGRAGGPGHRGHRPDADGLSARR